MEKIILETLKEMNRENLTEEQQENELLMNDFWELVFDRSDTGDLLLVAPVKINWHRYYLEIEEQFIIENDAVEMAEKIYSYWVEYNDLNGWIIETFN